MKECTKEELQLILEELLHNFTALFFFLRNERTVPGTDRDAENIHNEESLNMLLKGPLFLRFLELNSPKKYRTCLFERHAQYHNDLGKLVEESGVKIKRDRPM